MLVYRQEELRIHEGIFQRQTSMNSTITRRHALKTVAAATLAPLVGGFAADTSDRIRIGQIGTSHAHASGTVSYTHLTLPTILRV